MAHIIGETVFNKKVNTAGELVAIRDGLYFVRYSDHQNLTCYSEQQFESDCETCIDREKDYVVFNGVLEKYKGKALYITVPDTVTKIDNGAIPHYVRSIRFGKNVKEIMIAAFGDPDNLAFDLGFEPELGESELKTVYYEGSLEDWMNITIWGTMQAGYGDSLSGNPMLFADNLYIQGELLTDIVVPSTINCLNSAVFMGVQQARSIRFGANVTMIGPNALYWSGIREIRFDGSLEEWLTITREMKWYPQNYDLYIGDKLVKEVVIPETEQMINPYVFAGSTVESVRVKGEVALIGAGAFMSCGELKSISFEKGFFNKARFFDYCECPDREFFVNKDTISFYESGVDKTQEFNKLVEWFCDIIYDWQVKDQVEWMEKHNNNLPRFFLTTWEEFDKIQNTYRQERTVAGIISVNNLPHS